ncbi:MAG: hypothetical protein IPL67_03730 [Ignavibacteria bacterium]|nr:hypothetical protein [Ignavibacteria bacterium]
MKRSFIIFGKFEIEDIGRKERDVKFIIYQSLYIFVIATLGYHGLNLF